MAYILFDKLRTKQYSTTTSSHAIKKNAGMVKETCLKQSLCTKGASQSAGQSWVDLQVERSTFRFAARHSLTNDSRAWHLQSDDVALTWVRHMQVFSRQLVKYRSRLSQAANDESSIAEHIFNASSRDSSEYV